MFTLTFVDASGRREQVPLSDEARGIVVGRDESCDVVLDSKEVSRRHARFWAAGGALMVEDLGSHNGVYLRGARTEGPTQFETGVELELGDVRCTGSGTAMRAASAAAIKPVPKAAPVRKLAAAPAPTEQSEAPVASAPQGSARAGALAARARASAQAQGRPMGEPRPTRPSLQPVAAADEEPVSEVVGLGAGAVLRSLGPRGGQILLPSKAVVGRVKECDVVLDDDSVSRQHAELYRDDRGLFCVRDLDSANGTFIDGRRVRAGERIPEGAKLRFGDVELLFWKPPPTGGAQQRQKTLVAAMVVIVILFGLLYALKQKKQAERLALEAAQQGAAPEDEAHALSDQAQGALESDRFDEAEKLAQAALDKDPLAQAPRKILAQARREQGASKVFAEAQSKAAVGSEDEALRLFAQVDPQSRFFARSRIKAKDLATGVMRSHGKACIAESNESRWDDAATDCAAALDVKCQLQDVESDVWTKALRKAEKQAQRRVAWSCPPALAPLFHDALTSATSVADAAASERALRALYPDDKIRAAILLYARGDIAGAQKAITEIGQGHTKSAALAAPIAEKMRLVRGRQQEGQTAMMKNDLGHADESWSEALKADAELLPPPNESIIGDQMRAPLLAAHTKLGDERFQKGQYSTAYDEWMKGKEVAPKDPHLADALAQLEKIATEMLSTNPSCEQITVALHITGPESQAHKSALELNARCQ